MEKKFKPIDDKTYAKFLHAFLDVPLPPVEGLSEQMERASQEIEKAAEAERIIKLSRALFE